MKKKKGHIFLKVLCIFVFCGVLLMGFCEAIAEDLSGNIVRLHVIANSNSNFDQEVKLLARDIILKEATALAQTETVTPELVETNKEALQEAVNQMLREKDVAYTCQIVTGRFSFPEKTYENITLPRGDYDAVRVILGEGKGENWWCVMYPPLCFTESAAGTASEELLGDILSPVTETVISEEHIKLKPALKAVELWRLLKKKTDFKKIRLTFAE